MPPLLRLGISVAFVPAELGFSAELGGAATTTFPVTLAGGAPTYTPAGPPPPAGALPVLEPPSPVDSGPPALISCLPEAPARPSRPAPDSPPRFPAAAFKAP